MCKCLLGGKKREKVKYSIFDLHGFFVVVIDNSVNFMLVYFSVQQKVCEILVSYFITHRKPSYIP